MSLPTNWTRLFKLKSGDEIDVQQEGKILIISTQEQFKAKKSELNFCGFSPAMAWIYLTNAYIRGDDEVRVHGLFGSRMLGSDLDEKTLQAIAAKTGGGYFRARDIKELEEIYRLLDEIEPVSDEQQFFRPVKELYAWPLAAALLLNFILVFIRANKS